MNINKIQELCGILTLVISVTVFSGVALLINKYNLNIASDERLFIGFLSVIEMCIGIYLIKDAQSKLDCGSYY